MIRRCTECDFDTVFEIVNDAAQAYRGVIPADRWHEPYMPKKELREAIDQGVEFWGWEDDGGLIGVMGMQNVQDVTLIRHAYVRTACRHRGIGSELLQCLKQRIRRPALVGTWAAAQWAVRFYEKHGFRQVTPREKDRLLRRYWAIPGRQVETSVVLADRTWFAAGSKEDDTVQKTSLRKLEPAPFTRVKVNDRFWAPRMETNRRVTLPIEYKQCKDTGRIDAWTWKKGRPNEPHIFWDSDVGKWIEAAAYSLATHPDRKLERQIDDVVALMAGGQMKDGYLNSHFSLVEPAKRWTNLRDLHELYCAGHLMEGAVAYYQATGKRKFLDIMCRYADHIDRTFGPKKSQKRGYCGHPEVELALVKLYHATGNRRYLDLSKFFVDERGRRPYYYDTEARARGEDLKKLWFKDYSYCQSHKPLREQTEVVGHAVRAMYVYSGMADVAAETGDKSLLAAMKRLWENVTTKRMHVTGGLGPTSRNEGFTFDYDLPNENAYDETCANIALVFWAHRMLHLDPDGCYADVMERALYNSVVSGISLGGDHFFYANPLAAHPGVDPHGGIQAKDYQYRRSAWFGCACCPPNIARLLASFGGYIYSQGKAEARVNLYVAGRGELDVGGRRVVLEQETRYPWDGKVRLAVRPDKPASFVLALRIPGWCRPASFGNYAEARGAKLKVNGRSTPVRADKGYARISRCWQKGDVVELNMPMPVERIEAHPRVRQDTGRVALQRGPVVYCLEEVDNGSDLHDLVLPRTARLSARFNPKLLGGVTVITGRAQRRDMSAWKGALYRSTRTPLKSVPITAVPYAVWANRKPGEMIVWVRGEG